MITYSNIQRFDNMDFADYLCLPGYSHSFLKNEQNGLSADIFISENIRIGKLVDAVLTDPNNADINDTLYQVARTIAHDIKKSFGDLIRGFSRQVSYTGDVCFNGFVMPVKGRLDWLIPKHAVIDLKVTKSKNIRPLIDFMGYKNQVFHYAKLAGVPSGYLMIHSIPLRKTEVIKIDCSGNENLFWQEKILSFGKVQEIENDLLAQNYLS